MAMDLTLMDLARANGVGILRIYGWSQPTVSFGRNERTAGVYVANELVAAGLDVVRRPTGGRALLHAREVTYSVAMPVSDPTRWQSAYNAVNLRLLRAMQSLGVPAHIATGSASQSREVPEDAPSAPLPSHGQGLVCFSGIAQGEIAVGDRKLVASSVWRERGAYLQHGSILISDDQSRLGDLMAARVAKPEPAATLSEWISADVSATAITDQVEIALQDAFGDCGKSARWSIPSEVRQQVAVTRLALLQSAWLWRR